MHVIFMYTLKLITWVSSFFRVIRIQNYFNQNRLYSYEERAIFLQQQGFIYLGSRKMHAFFLLKTPRNFNLREFSSNTGTMRENFFFSDRKKEGLNILLIEKMQYYPGRENEKK